jgi:hypothetical protein
MRVLRKNETFQYVNSKTGSKGIWRKLVKFAEGRIMKDNKTKDMSHSWSPNSIFVAGGVSLRLVLSITKGKRMAYLKRSQKAYLSAFNTWQSK